MKQPLAYIKSRAAKTVLVMQQLASTWLAPGVVSPNLFDDQVTDLSAQEDTLSDKDALQAVAAGALDMALDAWHDASVLALKMGRLAFAGTDKEPSWTSLTANGGGRETTAREGREVESAWQASNATWSPKAALTLAAFQALRATAELKLDAFNLAEHTADIARAGLHYKADLVYDVCVRWYEMATANFSAGTVEGDSIRTIPTTYDADQAPGQLRFTEVLAPAPSQVRLTWDAPRGQRFNVYARNPGAIEFVKILDEVTFTHWMGEGLAAGAWAFKGEALNASGTGESSEVIIVPVSAALAA